MRRTRLLPLFALAFVITACDNEATVVRSENCFDACLSLSADVDAELDGQLALVSDIRASLATARAGLGAYVSTVKSLTGFVQAMADLRPAMPSGLTYEGFGRYSISPDDATRVELQFYLPKNTSFGAAGDLIDFNLFNVNSYFVGFGVKSSASISLSGIDTDVAFTFDSSGPGAELLGLPAGVSGPVGVDVARFSAELANVIVHASVNVSPNSTGSSVALNVVPRPLRAGAIPNVSVPLTVTEFVASGASSGQNVRLESSSLSLTKGGGGFDGTLRFASVSADFDFDMLFRYEASVTADVVLGCPGAELVLP